MKKFLQDKFRELSSKLIKRYKKYYCGSNNEDLIEEGPLEHLIGWEINTRRDNYNLSDFDYPEYYKLNEITFRRLNERTFSPGIQYVKRGMKYWFTVYDPNNLDSNFIKFFNTILEPFLRKKAEVKLETKIIPSSISNENKDGCEEKPLTQKINDRISKLEAEIRKCWVYDTDKREKIFFLHLVKDLKSLTPNLRYGDIVGLIKGLEPNLFKAARAALVVKFLKTETEKLIDELMKSITSSPAVSASAVAVIAGQNGSPLHVVAQRTATGAGAASEPAPAVAADRIKRP